MLIALRAAYHGCFLAVFLALALIAADWAWRHYVPAPRPLAVAADARIRNLGYEELALDAVRRFRQLPVHRRAALEENLRAQVVPLDQWLGWLRRSPLRFLCVGERHRDSTRRFLAERFLPALPIDALLLETPDRGYRALQWRLASGERYVPLLGADIRNVIESARQRNPAVLVAGVDESEGQRARRLARGGQMLRDASIVVNLRGRLRRGKRHLVLFGALHCSDRANWLFDRMRRAPSPFAPGELMNVTVVGRHQDGPVEAFAYLLDELGFARRDLVVRDPAALDPLVYEWLSPLTRTFGYYRAAVVFRESHGRRAPEGN